MAPSLVSLISRLGESATTQSRRPLGRFRVYVTRKISIPGANNLQGGGASAAEENIDLLTDAICSLMDAYLGR